MKVTYSPNSRMVFEVEAKSHQDLWERLAEIDELYSEDSMTCTKGKNSSKNVQFVVRTSETDDKYYELRCSEPFGHPLHRAKRSYGCNKSGGGLFAKRKDKENNYLPDQGWLVWDATTKKEI